MGITEMVPSRVELNGQDITHLVRSVGLSSPLRGDYRPDGTLEGVQVEYEAMTPREREDIVAWVKAHRVDPGLVPISVWIGYDPQTDEWRIPVHIREVSGRIRYDHEADEIPTRVLRRRRQPWFTTREG